MGNMSYCQFENTSQDIAQCLDALREGVDFKNLSSRYEQEGLKRFLLLCCEVSDLVHENHEDATDDVALVDLFIEESCASSDEDEPMEEE